MIEHARKALGAAVVSILIFGLVLFGFWYANRSEEAEKFSEAESRCQKLFQEASRSFTQDFQARAFFTEIHEAVMQRVVADPSKPAFSPNTPFVAYEKEILGAIQETIGKTGFKPIALFGTTASETALSGFDFGINRPLPHVTVKAMEVLASLFEMQEKHRFNSVVVNQYLKKFEIEMEGGKRPEDYRRMRTVFGPGFHLVAHKAFSSQRGIRSIPYFGRNAFFFWGWIGPRDSQKILILIYPTDRFNESISARLGSRILLPSVGPDLQFRLLAPSTVTSQNGDDEKNEKKLTVSRLSSTQFAQNLLAKYVQGSLPAGLFQQGSSWWFFKRLEFFQNPIRYLVVRIPGKKLQGSFAPLFSRHGFFGMALFLVGLTLLSFLVWNHLSTQFVSLRIQMALVFITATLLPIGTLVFMGFEYLRDRSRLLVQSEFESLSNDGLRFDGEARGKLAEIRDHIGQIRDMRVPLENTSITRVLDKFRQTNMFNSYQVISREGTIVASYSRVYDDQNRLLKSLYNLTLLTMDQFIRQEGSRSPSEEQLFKTKLAQAEMVGDALDQMFGQRETGNLGLYRGQFLSFRYGSLDIGILIDLIRGNSKTATASGTNLVQGGYFFFFDNDFLSFELLKRSVKGFFPIDTLVYFQSPVRYYLNGGSFSPDLPVVKQILRKLSNIGEGGRTTERVTLDGNVYLCSALRLPITKYSLILMRPLSTVVSSIRLIRILLVVVLFVSLLVALVIAATLVRVYLTPITSLNQGVNAVANGDLDFRVQIQSHDEFFELGKTFNMMVQQLQEKSRMSRFVSESVWDIVKKDSGTLELGGEERRVTVLFCDLRGFTTITEENPPQEVVSMLNEYLETMTEVIRRHHGVVDKFIGDAIMSVFYPLDSSDDEKRAVFCGLEMMSDLKRYNRRREERGQFPVGMGVGISTGLVIAGKIGSKNGRIDYTVIGDTVNVAARLEGMSKLGRHTKVVISDSTYQVVKEMFEAEPMGIDRVKGKARQVQMYEIIGPRKVEQFLADLSSREEPVRLSAVQALGLSGQAKWAEDLVPLLRDVNPKIRSSTAQALKNLISHDRRIVLHLKEALSQEDDYYVLASFILDIGLLGEDSDRMELVLFLDHDDTRIRANTVEALSFMHDRQKLQVLLHPKLNDTNNRTRANAAVLLYQIGDLSGLRMLLEMSSDAASALMRASGAYGIGEISSRERARELLENLRDPDRLLSDNRLALLTESRHKLENLLQDKDQMVRRNAAKALGRMGNENSLPELIRRFRASGADDPAKATLLSAITDIAGSHVLKMLENELTTTRT